MAYVNGWDESTPAGSSAVALGDNTIRIFKSAIRERLALDHDFRADESGISSIGCHKKVTMLNLAVDPEAVALSGILYTKTIAGATELYFRDAAGNIVQITKVGKIAKASIEV